MCLERSKQLKNLNYKIMIYEKILSPFVSGEEPTEEEEEKEEPTEEETIE